MKTLRIKMDYSHGPIWKDEYDASTGRWLTGIRQVDDDRALQVLNDGAETIYNSLYSFDDNGVPCRFDDKKFNDVKSDLLSIIQTILARLDELNDGEFSIVDEETRRLMA